MIQGGFKELLDEFLLEAHERAGEVESLLLRLGSGDAEVRDAALARAKRELHTLKGNAGMMGFSDLQQLTHHMEDQVEELDLEAPVIDEILTALDSLRQGLEDISAQTQDLARPALAVDGAAEARPAAAEPAGDGDRRSGAAETGISSVRVSFSRIDQLVEMQAESLIFRNRLLDTVQRGLSLAKGIDREGEDFAERSLAMWEDVEEAQQALEKVLQQLQEQVTQLSMVPLQGLFRSLRRLVHDESTREGKTVELVISGGETPIDKTLLEAAGDALGHLVRNSVIHGIETPVERQRQGKSETGKVKLSATIDANEILIEIADDGDGIDLAALRRQAEKTQGAAVATASDFTLLFEEGVSTREGADLSAGRGVGLSAVKKSVESHGGRIAVTSQRGVGTSFVLRLPVTASIMRSLTLAADGEQYALPLTAVAETLKPDQANRHEINHAGVVRWRNRVVPLLDLGCAFGTATKIRSGGFVIMMEINGRYRALAADEILDIRDIVVKGLDRIVGESRGISGSTILGDGRVIMILDPAALTTIPPFIATDT